MAVAMESEDAWVSMHQLLGLQSTRASSPQRPMQAPAASDKGQVPDMSNQERLPTVPALPLHLQLPHGSPRSTPGGPVPLGPASQVAIPVRAMSYAYALIIITA